MKQIRPFAEQGYYTGVHNAVFDRIMPVLSANAFKVLLLVIRQTKGRGRGSDRLAYSQLVKRTGIKTDHTVRAALCELLEGGYITCVPGTHKYDPTSYALNEEFTLPAIEAEATSTTVAEPAAKNAVAAAEIAAGAAAKNTAGAAAKNAATEKDELLLECTSFADAQDAARRASGKPSAKRNEGVTARLPFDHPLRAALLQACGIDADSPLTTKTALAQVDEAARAFVAAGHTAEQIAAVASAWYRHDWRGQRGDPPTAAQLRAQFARLLTRGERNGSDRHEGPAMESNAQRRSRRWEQFVGGLAERSRGEPVGSGRDGGGGA